MDSARKSIRRLGVALLGALLGGAVIHLADYYRGRPLELINANVQRVSSDVQSNTQALQDELYRLKSLTSGQPELAPVVARIDTLTQTLSADLGQIRYFSDAIESNFLWLAERERLSRINSLPDFVLPLNKGASLCGDGITFSVLGEQEERIETRLAGRRIHFRVGDERIFETDGERAKVAYLGRFDGYYQFRLLCTLA
ncbi:hypothetical protein FCL40_17270 [Ferrimonas sediminicola]|uniref:Uncharacterized protein n=1 Tax=Ferrimonas sediminicola TaxID=2569538 RepID=A0A4U1B9N8_9GAMM|nr:hypothetical protein [Ferrimonas sediminicola]TKB46803.1 hypothetical protein FCL40_17270 [Ferrimonas sediminicola]